MEPLTDPPVTLRLVSLGLVYGGVAYLLFSASLLLLAARARSWAPAVAAVALLYIAIVKLTVFVFQWWVLFPHEGPDAFLLILSLQEPMLGLAAISVGIFALRFRRNVIPHRSA